MGLLDGAKQSLAALHKAKGLQLDIAKLREEYDGHLMELGRKMFDNYLNKISISDIPIQFFEETNTKCINLNLKIDEYNSLSVYTSKLICYCGRVIDGEEKFCPQCGSDTNKLRTNANDKNQPVEIETKKCLCGHDNALEASSCVLCGRNI